MTKEEIQKNSEHWYNKYKKLETENNKLLDVINNQDVKIADLEQQIEKMKCCGNCKFKDCNKSSHYQTCWYCTNKDKWKLGR